MKTRVRVVSLRYFDHVVCTLSPRAFRVYAMAMQWSCYHATDGVLTPDDIESIGAKPAQLEELFKRRLLEVDDQGRTVLGELTRGPFVADVEGGEVEHAGELSPGAQRQRRWRERKRNAETPGDASGDVSETRLETVGDGVSETLRETSRGVSGGPTGGSGSESAPDPDSSSVFASGSEDLSGSARDSGKRAKRSKGGKKPWPAGGFSKEETADLVVYGKLKGLRMLQTLDQLEALQLWATSNGKAKSDWMATAKGWLRRYASEGRDYSKPPGAPRAATQTWAAPDRPLDPPSRTVFKPEEPDPQRLDPAAAHRAAQLALSAVKRPVPASEGKDAPTGLQ